MGLRVEGVGLRVGVWGFRLTLGVRNHVDERDEVGVAVGPPPHLPGFSIELTSTLNT